MGNDISIFKVSMPLPPLSFSHHTRQYLDVSLNNEYCIVFSCGKTHNISVICYLFICLSVYMFICLYVYMFICLYIYMFVCLYVCMFVCLYVCMFVCLYVCMLYVVCCLLFVICYLSLIIG